jgi:hypothetical protein
MRHRRATSSLLSRRRRRIVVDAAEATLVVTADRHALRTGTSTSIFLVRVFVCGTVTIFNHRPSVACTRAKLSLIEWDALNAIRTHELTQQVYASLCIIIIIIIIIIHSFIHSLSRLLSHVSID